MQMSVPARREVGRRRRLRKLAVVLGLLAAFLWWRSLNGETLLPLPSFGEDAILWIPGLVLIALFAVVLLVPMLGNARSPHVIYRPEQIAVGFSEVKGLGKVVGEVRHTLQVMLDYEAFRNNLGGNPRRGVLFEGPPGTGKTLLAKAMAKEAGVPFLFVSSTAFQSMWYGMTARRIRSFFRALRKAARREGGAIGFIEEIDAIGLRRAGSPPAASAGLNVMQVDRATGMDTGGIVNELLVQMQSFDEHTTGDRLVGWFKDRINRFLPDHAQLRKQPAPYSNILLVGATNRAVALDTALLRPGRFDRILHFDLPGRSARRELIDFFLDRKAHQPELDGEREREELAAATLGYSPASLERLFDEALLLALRDGRSAMTSADLRQARVEIEIGLPEPIDSPLHEQDTIAVHESGHAVMAYLVGKGRKLEVLSIVKRREALGFLAHRWAEERHTQTRSELIAQVQIALGGMVAEELFFGESGTGPAGDLAAATNVAVEMVGSMGMGGSLVSYRALDPGMLGGNLASRVLSDTAGREAVTKLLDEQKGEVIRVLSSNRDLIEALRTALLDRKELMDEEILEVIRDAQAARLAGQDVPLAQADAEVEEEFVVP